MMMTKSGKEIAMYYPNGDPISSIDEFVKCYSKEYFLPDSGEERLIPNLRRSSKHIEKEITDILYKGINTEASSPDVARILAWKIGKIKHGESMKCFVYSKDWVNAEQLEAKLYGKAFPLASIDSFIKEKKKYLEDLEIKYNKDYEDILNELEEKDFNRIGTVYMITLLFFLSQGEIPIYDRFAMLALSAILGKVKPNPKEKAEVKVKFKELPAKKTTRFKTIMSCEMKDYEDMLTDIFGDGWKKDRCYDQALWAYGHLFKPI